MGPGRSLFWRPLTSATTSEGHFPRWESLNRFRSQGSHRSFDLAARVGLALECVFLGRRSLFRDFLQFPAKPAREGGHRSFSFPVQPRPLTFLSNYQISDYRN